jgi:hypothetical protein
MSNNTIIQQGSFVSTGAAITIPLRSGVNWMNVYNYTQMAASQTTAVGVQYYWQLGMPVGGGVIYLKSNAANATQLVEGIIAPNGFTLIDTSMYNYGVVNATTTAISTASRPVVTNTGTNGLIAGQTVRILNQAGAPQFAGMDFTVGNGSLSSTTFSLDYAPQLTVAGTTGSWMLVNSTPLYYPSSRYITQIVDNGDGATTNIKLSVTNNYQVGQTLRLNIPAAYGAFSALNGVLVTVTAAGNVFPNNYVDVNIPTAQYGASLTFPLAGAVPYTFAQVVPVGENTALAEANNVNILNDATYNTAVIGMLLAGGVDTPGGATSDVMYWTAGKSFSNNGM